jgi:hypothetical protein
MLVNKLIITEMWVGCIDPVDLLFLPWTERFIGIETPDSFE